MMTNRRRRHYRRNPSLMGIQIPSVMPVLYTAAGYAGAVALEHVLTATTTNADGTTTSPLIPTSITGSTIGKYAVRIGCVIAEAYLAKMTLGAEKAKMVGIGGGVYVLVSAVKEFAPGTVPGLSGMREYRALAGYTPGLGSPRQVTQFGRRTQEFTPAAQLGGGRFDRF